MEYCCSRSLSYISYIKTRRQETVEFAQSRSRNIRDQISGLTMPSEWVSTDHAETPLKIPLGLGSKDWWHKGDFELSLPFSVHPQPGEVQVSCSMILLKGQWITAVLESVLHTCLFGSMAFNALYSWNVNYRALFPQSSQRSDSQGPWTCPWQVWTFEQLWSFRTFCLHCKVVE